MEALVSDEQMLIERTKAGDLAAFKRLYDTYNGFLYYFSLKFLKSNSLSEEVVQDVFVKLWEHRSRLDPDRSLKPYLTTICKNHIFNLLEKANRQEAIMEEIRCSLSVMSNQTEESLFASELQQTVEAIVNQLPDQRQRIFRMYRFEELDLDTIALTLDISKGTVKDHLVKANRFVRKNLNHRGWTFACVFLMTFFFLR